MQKRKGFTLIELLAVIVILAIIALIATPIVLNIIEKAEKGAAKSSAYGVVESLRLKYAESLLEGNFKGTSYNFEDTSGDLLGISNKPEKGIITLDSNGHMSGSVTYNGYTFYICNDKVSEEDIAMNCSINDVPSEPVIPEEPTYTKYDNGTAIYFNPETNTKCSESEAVSITGTKTGCMKWYTFNDSSESNTVNMILDHNTTAKVAWNSTGSNSEMKEVKVALENDITTWNENIKSTARLITVDELLQIIGVTSWNKANNLFFETGTSVQPNPYSGTYSWLYNYTNKCTSYGCDLVDSNTSGYWTSTPDINNSDCAWRVYSEGRLSNGSVDYATAYGVRPVITITKSNI